MADCSNLYITKDLFITECNNVLELNKERDMLLEYIEWLRDKVIEEDRHITTNTPLITWSVLFDGLEYSDLAV